MTEHPHYVTLVLGLLALPVNSGLRDTHFEGSPCISPQHVLGPCGAFYFFYLVSNFFYASLAMQKKRDQCKAVLVMLLSALHYEGIHVVKSLLLKG